MTPAAEVRILISIPLDRCKSFLDSAIYRELKRRYPIAIVSYLSDRGEFRAAYGGPGVEFQGAPRIEGRWRWRLYNFTEILRHFGFLFRFRHGPTKLYWLAETRYRWLAAGEFRRPRYARQAAFHALAWMEHRLALRRRIVQGFGRWIFASAPLERLFETFRPTVFISTAHKTDQEKIVAHHAARAGLRSIFLPDSTDSFNMNGELFHSFDVYAVWGPLMREHATFFHAIPGDRLMPLGVPVHRVYEELIAGRPPVDLRGRYHIPPGKRIITYLSIWKLGFLDLYPSIDALAAAIGDGRIRDAVVLLRTCPWEDPAEAAERYRDHPHVRVQAAPNDSSPDFSGDAQLHEYASTLQQSSVVVMSATTGGLLQTCRLGIPTIANLTEISAYPEGGFSPRSLERHDPVLVFSRGLPAAHDLDELVALVNRYLDEPDRDRDVWKRISDDWDYGDPDYVDRFLAAVTNGSFTAAAHRPAARPARAVPAAS